MILDQIQGLKQEGPSLTKKKGFLSASLLLNMLVPKLPGGKGHPPQMGLFQAVLHFFSPRIHNRGEAFPCFLYALCSGGEMPGPGAVSTACWLWSTLSPRL